MWIVFLGSLSLILIVILLFQVRNVKVYSKHIEEAKRIIDELSKGNYHARTYGNHPLARRINVLARNLEDMKKSHEMEHDRLYTLIENMGSGLIVIDKKGYVNLINRAFSETFHVDRIEYEHKLYYQAFKMKVAISIVEEIFITEVKVRKQIQLSIDNDLHHFEVYGAPIIGTNEEWKGIVLVFHDITDIKRLEQMRKDFVANVSHELKTPITSIKGFSETLLDGAMNDSETLEAFLSIILKESDRLQTLVQDLLDLSKLEQNNFILDCQKVDLLEILDDIFKILNDKADKKGIDLMIKNDAKSIFIDGDINRLKQVFLNIITNCLTYTGPAGKITVEICDKDDEVEIRITDTGIGIEEYGLPRIFERFYRVDKARSRNSGGTGLGLAIVKHIIEAHHGKIFVDSEVNVGTTFILQLKKNLKLFQN